jgi:hypothetical protein
MRKRHKQHPINPAFFWLALMLLVLAAGLIGWYWIALVHFGYGIPSRW